MTRPSFWDEGFAAGKAGLTYADNPYEPHEDGATAWAFGCSEGMKECNRAAFAEIMRRLPEMSINRRM